LITVRGAVWFLLAVVCCVTATTAQEPAISWTSKLVEVRALPEPARASLAARTLTHKEWQSIFSVQTESADILIDPTAPCMVGSYKIDGASLQFTPAFPLEPGVKYRATFRPDRLPGVTGKLLTSTFTLNTPAIEPTTEVSAVYPTSPEIPENILKFYIHFSAPMSRGGIYDHILLKDDSGALVELPFLEIDQELWNRDLTRLTLFLDPGRIKRGVKPLEEIGGSFKPGRSYTLEVATTWKDANGAPLAKGFQKQFTVTTADRKSPDPAAWKVEPPPAKSKAALLTTFDEPLDHAIATRTINVRGQSGAVIPGKTTLAHRETQLRFEPDAPWQSGSYTLEVPSLIEDLAGNNIGELFDVDTSQGERHRRNEIVRLKFAVE